jgi:hypothetical protein
MKKITKRTESSQGIPPTKIDISSLVISIPAKKLDIKKHIVKCIESTIQ